VNIWVSLRIPLRHDPVSLMAHCHALLESRMARRTKTSPFEDLIFIASRLPWWLSLLIALAAWLYFHSVAISPPPTVTDPKQFASAAPPAPVSFVPAQASAPSCPVCNSDMQKRVAKRGANIGNEFWGRSIRCAVE
jgi:hypothetical protein